MKSQFPILIEETKIEKRVVELGLEISNHFKNLDKPLVVLGVLKGSFIFMADLVRALHIPCEMDFIELSSYGSGTTSSGTVKLKREPSIDLKGRHVLVVEDIIDTGHTFKFLHEYLGAKNPASLKTCAFLDKPSRRLVPMSVDFVGFPIEDHFVLGYGLDLDGRYREFSSIVIYQQS